MTEQQLIDMEARQGGYIDPAIELRERVRILENQLEQSQLAIDALARFIVNNFPAKSVLELKEYLERLEGLDLHSPARNGQAF